MQYIFIELFLCLNLLSLFLLSNFAQLLPTEITHFHLLCLLCAFAGLHLQVMARSYFIVNTIYFRLCQRGLQWHSLGYAR